jgi:hypothetical protein
VQPLRILVIVGLLALGCGAVNATPPKPLIVYLAMFLLISLDSNDGPSQINVVTSMLGTEIILPFHFNVIYVCFIITKAKNPYQAC